MKNLKISKKKSQQILATFVMGMNLVNSMAPLAGAVEKMPAAGALALGSLQKSEAQTVEYEVLPQMLDFMDRVIYAKAEAFDYTVDSGETVIVEEISTGDTMHISSGGTGIISAMVTGVQYISGGGVGTISTMSDGWQCIYSGGSGTISTMNGGYQELYSGGSGTISMMSGGYMRIYSGGSGTISTMSGGVQYIYNGGSGTISTMNGGYMRISSGGMGSIGTMNSGAQYIYSGATGNIGTMNHGWQNIYSGGVGVISTMSGGGQYIYNGGSGTISTMSDGYQRIYGGGTGSIGTMNSGAQYIDSGATGSISTMSGGEQKIYSGGTALDTNIYGGMQVVESGGVAENTTITGGTQVVSAVGEVKKTILNAGTAVMMGDTAVVSDVTMSGGSYLLGSDSGNYNIGGKFNFTGGEVDMTKNYLGVEPGTYETLNIANLEQAAGAGTGTFIMDTDLASETNSDKINILDSDGGKYYVQVKDVSLTNGITVEGHKNLLLITDTSEKASFTGKDLNAGGLWTFMPRIENGTSVTDDAGNVIGTKEQWYLTHVEKKVNGDTQVLNESEDGIYALWRNTMDTMRKRLGELHYNSAEPKDGIWGRYIAGKFNNTGGHFDGKYNMLQLGYDVEDNAKSIYGIGIERGTGRSDYSMGSGKDEMIAGSFYGTWSADNGSYTDVVAKIGKFDTDIKSYGEYPDKGSYKKKGYSLSVEYGKNIKIGGGRYIEPQMQIIAGRLTDSNYTTDRGTKVRSDGMNSYIGRLGINIGEKGEEGNGVYLKASVLHEFGGKQDIYMQAANGEVMGRRADYKDTWLELGIGTNVKLSKSSTFYGDIERSFGGDIEKKWQINAGVRFEF